MRTDYAFRELCEAFDVSRSGYHAWASRRPSARDQAAVQWQPLIAKAQVAGRQAYGRPRVMRWLRPRGHRCRRRRVGRLLRPMGLSHRFKLLSLTDRHHDWPSAPNLLPHRVPTLKPDTVWVAGLTDVPTGEG